MTEPVDLPDGPKEDGLQIYKFEVVTVNGRGNIIGRKIHRVQQFTEELGNDVPLGRPEIDMGESIELLCNWPGD